MPSAPTQSTLFARFGWLTGLPVLALIIGAAIHLGTPRIEAELAGEAARVVAATGEAGAEPWLVASVQGRDLSVSGEAPSAEARAAALRQLDALPGLRRLENGIGLVEPASPFVWTATRSASDRIEIAGSRPAEIGPAGSARLLAPALPAGVTLRDGSRRARGAPPDFGTASAYSLARLGELLPGAKATIEDTTLSFAGEAASAADYERFRAALTELPHGYTLAKAEILPAKVEDFRFSVSREPGRLVLSGNVISEAARAEIRALASEISEGATVEDRTRTARGLDLGIDPAALTRFMFRVAGLMQDGSVELAGATLSAVGTALDRQATSEVGAFIRDARPAGIGEGTVRLGTRPLSPYRVTIRREAESVTLSGHLPDDRVRERLLAALRPRFFHERVVDRLRIAEGAPAELPAVLDLALGSLSTLARGEAALADRTVKLSGESLYRESAGRIASDFRRSLPASWQSDVAIRAPGETEPRDEAACAAAFGQAVEGKILRFTPGSTVLTPEFYPLLDALAALAKSCPATRIEVSGHADPAGTAPRDAKPVLDTAVVDSTASVDTTPPRPDPVADAGKARSGKTDNLKGGSRAANAAPGSKPPAKPAEAKAVANAPAAPEPDLPRQRALVILDYLTKAGIPVDRVVAAPDDRSPSERQGIGFTRRP
ncbi:BON domain-containing protein [Methylobacterium iners]|uniref:BON domain-containing protein n=1 Tax=Methylobacterium iners TaxID=418707 RepID=A0ABQ4RZX1_9HYPH|nr:BON domain-containing protein [Methylobacterium iners]GJD95950.1 hypothetical protein OCOJLMKI_3167 [Methylobacterium iners]